MILNRARSAGILNIKFTPVGGFELDYVDLDLFIWQGDRITDKPASPNISFRKNAVNPNKDLINIDISPIVLDYVKDGLYWVEASGTLYTVSVGSAAVSYGTYLGVYGYAASKDDSTSAINLPFNNGAISDNVLLSNTKIYWLSDNLVQIPVLRDDVDDVVVEWYKDGFLVNIQTLTPDDDTATVLVYADPQGGVSYENFKERVESTFGTFEDSPCNDKFFNQFEWGEVDKVRVYKDTGSPSGRETVDIDICYVEECKYTPYKCTFTNKHGADQVVYFYKKTTSIEQYEDEILSRSVFGFDSDTVSLAYNNQSFYYNRENANATETLSLNTGFINESYNDVIQELLLSEKVFLENTETGEVLPVIVKSKNRTVKNIVNDKLINYTIDFQYAHKLVVTFY